MGIEKIKAIILFVLTLLHLLAAYLIWRRGKTKATFHLGWCFLFSALFCLSWAGVYTFQENKLLWTRAHWMAAPLGTHFLFFVYYFTNQVKYIKIKIIFWGITGYAVALLSLFTPYFFISISPDYPYLTPASAGVLNLPLGRGFTILIAIFTIYYLIKGYRQETGFKKWQIKYLIWGMVLTSSIGLVVSGIWPLITPGYNPLYNEISAYGTIVLVAFTAYAILKNNLFDIKIVLAELLTTLIGLVLLVQIFLMESRRTRIIETAVFILFCFMGYLLIKATRKVIEKEEHALLLSEKLEELNKNLEMKVDIKTKELRIKVAELSDSQKALVNLLEDNTNARQQMELEKNKTLAIIANFTDPIIVLDKDNKIGMINPAATRIFGLDSAVLGRVVSKANKFSFENFRSIIKKEYTVRQINSGDEKQNFTLEETTLSINNQELTYKIITANILDTDKEYLGTMKIFYDLTREKMIDKMKSDFITIAAHQLRTPLSAIKWAIKLVLDGDTGAINDEQRKLLYQGYLSNERVIGLINDMLNVSRIEEGRFGYTFSRSDFREILFAALEKFEYQLKTKKIALTQSIPDQEMFINMDKEKITLVVDNLMENAVNYTPESGKIEMAVEMNKKQIKLKIKDNGVGIPAEDQEKMYSKFFRANNVIRMQTEGSGLSMFISKNIISQHKGSIKFKSEEGRGTEFVVTLPVK